jgi:exopolyphosphatase/guanosine-5'-triphosphate,3'-diphosphate pyrophosphatase
VKVGVVDIGTNSMRLLITDGITEVGRWVEVTGLGRGVDRTGTLSPEGMHETLGVLSRFGATMDRERVERRKAIATSASRDASNRETFFDRVASVLGVRPSLISGDEEAHLAYAGATTGAAFEPPVVVSDIGGGSSEFVTAEGGVSIDIGSVRLTERAIETRPTPPEQMDKARALVTDLFRAIALETGTLIGVAGTWTSLGAMSQHLPGYSRDLVHGYRMSREALEELIVTLAGLSAEETAAIPSLDPKRAPVILAGALVAGGVMDVLGVDEVVVSEHDTLDGVAMELLALP